MPAMRLCMSCGNLTLENDNCSKCGDYQEEPEATAERLIVPEED
jgi:rRNA maturation protein Nop10